ncbi:hypothetical protein AAZX31_10G058400 [Glycine max]|uniref:Glycosyltransferase n=3 Tax=Glycine subgen. Soja TaxID=1462606 RepID=I1L933_SOYBN|nr:hypothetical protein JHK87_026964 [Glycine soja]KAG4996264.1 hypothetical protein JHK85_027703 [Glycine max]KAG5003066.1 hypothetical protein JHK86_027205 [Glycine max]KAG5126243.1 hypothetical protein JHK82_027078 [Glycine max]KAG5150842.1 hypothetical protein JHK84_027314 [Glycine max]|eukprot:XP_025979829.1 UDP-glycosyltransferase 73C3 [Glycine max]
METTPERNLHFVFIPLMLSGCMRPLVDMAKLMARRKVKVTIVTTARYAVQFKASIDREIQSGSSIQIQLVTFPNAEVGVPEGFENIQLPSIDLKEKLFTALSMLQPQLEELLKKLNPFPCCIIHDKHIFCVADIAVKLKVPRITYDRTNCFNLLCNHNLLTYKVYETVSSDSDEIIIPGLPHRIEMRKCRLPTVSKPYSPNSSQKMDVVRERIRGSEAEAYGIVVNSFEEFEAEYVEEYQRVTGHKVWCVGPLSLTNKDDWDKVGRVSKSPNASEIETNQYMKWLSSWPQSSVIYVGSFCPVEPKVLIEIGLGLEATKRPFIWDLKGIYRRDEMERWLSEERFEVRVKDKGILIRDNWLPQVSILSHRAVGAFFTHAGWISTLDAICAGVPLVILPVSAVEMFYNEKLLSQVAEIGVTMRTEIAIHCGGKDKYGECVREVKKDSVKEAIEKVMRKGGDHEKRREKAKKYADMAKKTIEEGGSSYHNMSMLIDDIVHAQSLNQS